MEKLEGRGGLEKEKAIKLAIADRMLRPAIKLMPLQVEQPPLLVKVITRKTLKWIFKIIHEGKQVSQDEETSCFARQITEITIRYRQLTDNWVTY